MSKRIIISALLASAIAFAPLFASAEDLQPYGTAKVNMHKFPKKINVVFDVNYKNPEDLNLLYFFVKNTVKVLGGKAVVVTHGRELRAFAKENYAKYQGIMQKMAELKQEGVEFHMCNNAMHAAGFTAKDMNGLVTIVPAGFPEIAYYESKGYAYINPNPISVKDVRYLDHPELKK